MTPISPGKLEAAYCLQTWKAALLLLGLGLLPRLDGGHHVGVGLVIRLLDLEVACGAAISGAVLPRPGNPPKS